MKTKRIKEYKGFKIVLSTFGSKDGRAPLWHWEIEELEIRGACGSNPYDAFQAAKKIINEGEKHL